MLSEYIFSIFQSSLAEVEGWNDAVHENKAAHIWIHVI